MKIILIRHGIADVFADTDMERHLTTEGRIRLNAAFTDFVATTELKDFTLYASPAARTMETAELLSEKTGLAVHVVESLYDTSYTDFIASLTKNSIIVGHEPYLSDALYKLGGIRTTVSRGTIHVMEV
ncbi:histidine phosphatase family protein [Peptoniphilus equinus]|uniref:Histidine phosphatase family protein n=1 Tax=Peptoniphilus equinus TaxID=3016343 RepID=A0ABY7QTX0_9FIRM|nr:histidine phosphatase family protein [Peptoniphilus equinus]WBW49816.1 histidine phosphatase family protein [Peptoniphilus equinus]